MKNSSSGIRLFAAALNYASKIAHGDPEYTLEKANKIFPPRYFETVVKEYSNLTELNRYAKTRRVLLTKASWSYQYAADYLQLANKQIESLKEFKKDWQDVISKQDLNNKDYKIVTELSRAMDKNITSLTNAQNTLQKWLYNIGLLQNTASINRVLEHTTKIADALIGITVDVKSMMIDTLHMLINKEN